MWVKNFLSERVQVKVNYSLSSWYEVLNGVAQDSVLGPRLCVIYTNDMFECLPDGIKLKLFADDAKIYASLTDISEKLNYNFVLIILQFGLKGGNCHFV